MTISSYSSMNMMPPVGNISKDIVTQNDKNSDSSLSIDELGVSQEQFTSLDTDSDGLVTQNEIATAIDNKLSSYSDGQMPSKEEFASLLSDMGLEMPEPPQKQNSSAGNDFASMIMSSYDSDGDSLLSSTEASVLSEEEFSSLDSNSDGTISTDELSSAFEQVASSEGSKSAPPPPPPSGGSSSNSSSSSSTQTYDPLDTNKDGVVSEAEKNAATTSSTSTTTDNSDVKDTIKMLLDAIKQNSSDSDTASLDLNNFKNIMKMLNNQTDNSDLNSYVKNLSSKSTSSNISYA